VKEKQNVNTHMQATTAPIPDIGLEDEFVESVRYAQLDLKKAASNMTNDEARFLVNRYYDVQNDRKAYKSQSDSLGKAGEPTILVNWMAQQMASTENHIKKYLDAWSDESIVGKWAKSNFGIGPVISAGLLCRYVVHFHLVRFCETWFVQLLVRCQLIGLTH